MAKRPGLTLIELLMSLVILSIFILIAIFAWKTQLMKARDAKRKADLKKAQNVLEDYLNDEGCYPEELEGFRDPLNTIHYHYFYSGDKSESCRSWYKIYTRLEYEKDPIIDEVGCRGGCGPSNNYNYWVSSSNITQVAQLPGELWPSLPPLPGSSPSPGPGTPTPTSPAGTPTPTPTPGGPTPTPTPTPIPVCTEPICGVGPIKFCLPNVCATCCPGTKWRCNLLGTQCCYDEACL